MTKAQAGALGGRSTVRKHGKDHMRTIGRMGAVAFHAKYRLEPVNMDDFAIVNRETGEVLPPHDQRKRDMLIGCLICAILTVVFLVLGFLGYWWPILIWVDVGVISLFVISLLDGHRIR